MLVLFVLYQTALLPAQTQDTPIFDYLCQLENDLDSKSIQYNTSLCQIIIETQDPLMLIQELENHDPSRVYSTCVSRYLTYAEVALIVMEHIEPIPYFAALGIQNCTRVKCPGNSNLIEYFFAYWGDYNYEYLLRKYRHYLTSERRILYMKIN